MEDILTKGNIQVADICGYWEVIHNSVNQGSKEPKAITRRDRYIFLPQMAFIRISGGQPNCGTWELTKKESESESIFSIILNEISEYIIVNINDNNMILIDRMNKLSLVRRM